MYNNFPCPSMVGVDINTNTNYDDIQKYINCFPFTLILFLNIYPYNSCHRTMDVILLKYGEAKGYDYVYDLFLIVFVHCIDIYADHCTVVSTRSIYSAIN